MGLPYDFDIETLIKEDQTVKFGIDTITEWAMTTTSPQIKKEMIFLFLRACSNDIEATKKAVQAYFRIRRGASAIFGALDTDGKAMKIFSRVIDSCIVPIRTSNNSVIMIGKLSDTNYRNFDCTAMIKGIIMYLDVCQITNPPEQLIVIFDFQGVSFMHLLRLKFGQIVTLLKYIQEGLPLKITRIHVLNSNFVFDKFLALFRMFINSKLLTAFRMYPPEMNIEDFHSYVPASHLPKDYGGDLPYLKEMKQVTLEELRKRKMFFEAGEDWRRSWKALD